jgi:copper chaperone NosL
MKRRSLLKMLFALPFGLALAAPRALRVGVDVCPFCNMTILDARFAAQMITGTGRVFNYDDVGCLLDHQQGRGGPRVRPAQQFVADFAASDRTSPRFLVAGQARFLFNERIRTPMGVGLLAFGRAEELEAYLRQRPQFADAQRLDWNDLLRLGRQRAWIGGHGR